MASFSVRPGTFEDIAAIAAVVRAQDADECMAACGLDVRTALEMAHPMTEKMWAGEVDGQIVVLAGVSSSQERPDIGVPWMMSSPVMDEVAIPFLKENRWVVDEMKEEHLLLTNFVDARNVKAIRWLKWLGFRILPAETHGAP